MEAEGSWYNSLLGRCVDTIVSMFIILGLSADRFILLVVLVNTSSTYFNLILYYFYFILAPPRNTPFEVEFILYYDEIVFRWCGRLFAVGFGIVMCDGVICGGVTI